MAAWLASRGHSVRVVTAPPYYPGWRVAEGYSAARYKAEDCSGVKVYRCPLWIPQKPTGLKRIVHLLSFSISSFPVMLFNAFWRPHIVLVIEPPLFCAPQAWLTAAVCGAESWLHIQDFEVGAFFGLGFSSSNALKRIAVGAESWLMRRFSRVSTISGAMLARLLELRVAQDRTCLFPNWVDVDYFNPGQGSRELYRAWGIGDDKKVILYSGNMSRKQGLELLITVAKELETSFPQVVFVLAGDGPAKSDLIAAVARTRASNILFKPLQPEDKFLGMLQGADIHLVVQKRGAADSVMPSKLTTILSVGGLAVITADPETELGRFVAQNPGAAVLAEPESGVSLKKAILDALSEKTRQPGYVKAARSYAESKLSKKVVLGGFEGEAFACVKR